MSVELLTILMFASMIILLVTGLPIVFVIGGVAVLFAYFVVGPSVLGSISATMYGLMNNFVLLAAPLFIFMAGILERSGVADDLYTTIHRWFGGVRGGLAIGTVIICTIFAAMSGVSAAATVTMGLIALPSMLKRHYDKRITVGCIAAGGALGQLIPPSCMMIVWALWAGESVGQMFLGGVIPGLILSALFIIYIGIRCYMQPTLGPSILSGERAGWKDKLVSLRAVLLPVLIIIGVLGSIFSGIATPTEAAAVGALGSIISAAVYRRLSWSNVSYALMNTLRLNCMIMWIMTGGAAFAAVFTLIGAQQFVLDTVQGLGVNRWLVLIGMQLIYLFLGMMMEPTAIMMVTVPIFVPIITALGFDSLWFGVLFIVNMELAFLTPPFGLNLFYLRAIVPKDITMIDIYSSVWPFIVLQVIGLGICIVFPQTVLYLPNLLLGR